MNNSPAKPHTHLTVRLVCALVFVSLLSACANLPPERPEVYEAPRGYRLPPALSEIYRNGELRGMEQNTSGVLGMPNDSDLVQRVCVSKPQFNLYGQYVTTLVNCW